MMKKLIYGLTLVMAIASCKKKEVEEFQATDVTRSATVIGVVDYDDDNYIEGVEVTVKVAKSALYGNNAQGYEYYTALTDAKGKYTVSIKVNESGNDVEVIFPRISRTSDELGIYESDADYILYGYSDTYTVDAGETTIVDYSYDYDDYTYSVVGKVSISGTLYIEDVLTLDQLNNPVQDSSVLANRTFDFYYEDAEDIERRIQVTTDANGNYSLELEVTEEGIDLDELYVKTSAFEGGNDIYYGAPGLEILKDLSGRWGEGYVNLTPDYNVIGWYGYVYSDQVITIDFAISSGNWYPSYETIEYLNTL